MTLEEFLAKVAIAVEAVGVLVIVVGGVAATVTFFRNLRAPGDGDTAYRLYRRGLGRGLLLGLEFLVAGDIIRTVTESPSLQQVAVLGTIVLIRTFLSVALELETEGRWPWQARDSGGPNRSPPT